VQIKSTEIIRALEVYINPSLTWDKQFKIMKDRTKQSITKLINIDVNTQQVYLYFNMYLIRSVYFGCSII